MSHIDRPSLSIIIATVQDWDEMEGGLERLLPQAEAIGCQVIVASLTPPTVTHPNLQVEVLPGKSVFELRAAAVPHASGEIVAVTEDHCRVASDWCTQILAAHQKHPEVGLIGGRIRNGSQKRLIDWANFLLTFSPFLTPSATPRGSRIPPAANVSYKSDRVPANPATGELEITLPERLQAERSVVMVDGIEVTHFQSHGFFSTFSHHFDNGRATAGLALIGASRKTRWRRVRMALRAFPRLLWVTVRNTMNRRVDAPLRAKLSLPLVVVVIASHTVGEIIGATRGPGASAHRLS